MVSSGGPKDYFLRAGDPVFEFTLFISSGSDVAPQRDLFEQMIRAVNNQFRLRRDPEKPFILEVDRWEHDAPRRTSEMNEEFVRRACAAHATVVLLSTEVRPGTKEEIEAVLEVPGVQLSVIWMVQPGLERKHPRLKKFLRDHEADFAYYKTSEPGSAGAIVALVNVVAASLADVTRTDRQRELFSEQR